MKDDSKEGEWTHYLEDEEEKEEKEQQEAEWSHHRRSPRNRASLANRMKRWTKQRWARRWKPAMSRNTKNTVAVAVFGILMWFAGKIVGLHYSEIIREAVIATQPATRQEAYLTTLAAVGVSVVVAVIAAFMTMWIGMMVIFSDVRGKQSIPRLIWNRPWTLAIMFLGWMTAYLAILIGLMIPARLMVAEFTFGQATVFVLSMLALEYVVVWMVDQEYRSLYQTSNPAVIN
jgi:hypothetical protein